MESNAKGRNCLSTFRKNRSKPTVFTNAFAKLCLLDWSEMICAQDWRNDGPLFLPHSIPLMNAPVTCRPLPLRGLRKTTWPARGSPLDKGAARISHSHYMTKAVIHYTMEAASNGAWSNLQRRNESISEMRRQPTTRPLACRFLVLEGRYEHVEGVECHERSLGIPIPRTLIRYHYLPPHSGLETWNTRVNNRGGPRRYVPEIFIGCRPPL